MKSIILAFALSLALTAVAMAWTHGVIVNNGFITDLSSVVLTNDSGTDNLLAQ